MMTLRATLASVACLLVLSACAKQSPPPPSVAVAAEAGETKGGGLQASDAVRVTATVEAIDQKTRKVTLLKPDGQRSTFTAGPEVRNLAQVKKGDQVVATYLESVAVRLRKPGEATPGVSVAEESTRARPGEKPGAAEAQVTTITAKVVGVDQKKQTVTLEGPEGRRVPVKVKDPTQLAKVKTGDLVEITYTEALALTVEKP